LLEQSLERAKFLKSKASQKLLSEMMEKNTMLVTHIQSQAKV
jgi:hypothetical protein